MATRNLVSVESFNNSTPYTDSNRLTSESIPEVVGMEVDVGGFDGGVNSAMFSIQPDWHLALRKDNGKAWITFKQRGQMGIHTHLMSEGESKKGQPFNISIEEEEFQLTKITSKSLEIAHLKAKYLSFKIIFPEKVFNSIHDKNVSSLDVSSGGLGVSAGDDGSSLFIWETSQGVVRRNLKGHYGDIYNCQLFPSGVVVLSSGADMRIKIWSAEDGSCPVTLAGHSAPITDTAIIDKGMNIVSTSKDGTVRIWSCGKGKCLEPAIHIEDVLNCCDILNAEDFPSSISIPDGDSIDREDEAGLEGKILAVGGENGTVALVSLLARSVHIMKKIPGKNVAVNAISFLTDSMLIVGCENGKVLGFSVPEVKVLWELHDSDSSITSLLSLPKQSGFIAGKLDGTCVFYSLTPDKQLTDLRVLLSGADADPVNTIKSDESHIYTGARDGKIRKYSIADI